MRRFKLLRSIDVSGISGTGHVANGVQFPDGKVVTQWIGEISQVCVWSNIEHVEKIHGHNGATAIVWIDE